MLESLRDLHKERYTVELVLYPSSADEAPAIGAECQPVNCLHRHRIVVTRRTQTPVIIGSQKLYQSSASPVVAQGIVGYEPRTTRVNEGLDVSIIVGTDAETADGTSIKISGDLRQVSWPEDESASKPTDPSSVFQHPLVSIRSIQSHVQIKYGKLLVLGLVAGFEDGKCFVLAGSVRKL
jgi:hypothetical protein